MGEPAAPVTPSLGAIQARLDLQIPHLYRDLALYLQVLREVLPASLDQACSYLATRVHPGQYNHLPPRARGHLHDRLKSLLGACSSLLTVEQVLSLAGQMERERQRISQLGPARWLQAHDATLRGSPPMAGVEISFPPPDPHPSGSIKLSLHPSLTLGEFAFLPAGLGEHGDGLSETDPASLPHPPDLSHGDRNHRPSSPETLWSTGQLPRDPVQLIHCFDRWNAALGRRLRILSHSVNLELMRAGVMAGALPVPLLDAVLAGQIEPQGAPPNLLRLPLSPSDSSGGGPPPIGVLLRTVDLEMEQPRLRTCRRRLLNHRQEILKMAETSHRLQRRLQVLHAERLWRHDSQMTPPEGT